MKGRTGAVLALALAMAVGACAPGPPARPSEDLRPTIVGIVKTADTAGPRFVLEDGQMFEPPSGAHVRELLNDGDAAHQLNDSLDGTVLLAGQRADGSWWWERTYREQAGEEPLCMGAVFGGSWDEGDSIHFSSGVRVAKAPNFAIHDAFEDQPPFPGKGDDYVCLDSKGHALFLKVAHYM